MHAYRSCRCDPLLGYRVASCSFCLGFLAANVPALTEGLQHTAATQFVHDQHQSLMEKLVVLLSPLGQHAEGGADRHIFLQDDRHIDGPEP